MSEVASFVPSVDQFEGGESAYMCVAFSAALIYYSVKPGTTNPYSAEQVDQLADSWYAREEGSYSASNTNGMGIPELHDMLNGMGLKWIDLGISTGSAHDSDIASVKAALGKGYPVMICGAETGFVYAGSEAVPYSWAPSGNHCIVTSAVAPSGNLLVRDMAALRNGNAPGSLQEYDTARMFLISGTAIVPSWIGGTEMAGVPQGWHDDGTTLTAPNGNRVVLGFRAHVLAGWDATNLPLENEHHVDALEPFFLKQPDGGGEQQVFYYKALCYTPTRGVYEMALGASLVGYRNQVAPLAVQITTLQAELAAALASGNAALLAKLKAGLEALVATIP